MIKLSTRKSVQSELDLVSSAQEACDAYQQLLSSGYEISELSQVVDNLAFARDTIKAHGAKWYLDNCDPMNTLGKAINSAAESLTAKKVDAAMEGFFGDIWKKIVEWWNKFVDWIKNLFKKDAKAEVTKNVEEAKETTETAVEEITKEPEKAKELPKTEVKVPASKKLSNLFSRLVNRFKKTPAKEALDGSVNPIEGAMFTVKGMKLFNEVIPQAQKALMAGVSDMQSIISEFNSAKTLEAANSITAKLQERLKNNPVAEVMEKYNAKLDAEHIESKGPITFEQMGIHNVNDAKSAIEEFCKAQTLIGAFESQVVKSAEKLLEDGARAMDTAAKNFDSSDEDSEFQKLRISTAKEISTGSKDLAEMTEIFKELIVGLSGVAKDIANGLAKVAA